MNRFNPGQLMLCDIPGTTLEAETRQFLQQYQLRGVCLFRKNIVNSAQLKALTGALRAVLGPQGIIAIDHEGGAVIRATFLSEAPSAMSMSAADDETLTGEIGYVVGQELRAHGINVNFAPVLDVNTNPLNPVIAERSFGRDANQVIKHATAWATGLMRAGVACCGKHFPGHGDTVVDSHLSLPTLNHDLASMEQQALVPFRALAAKMPMMMSAHILFPDLDAALPATLSCAIIDGLLRKSLNFNQVVVTDALNMHAITEDYGQARAASMAIEAGADLALVLGSLAEIGKCHAAISDKLQANVITEPQLQCAQQRLKRLTEQFPLPEMNAETTTETTSADDAQFSQVNSTNQSKLPDNFNPSNKSNPFASLSAKQLMRRCWQQGLSCVNRPWQALPEGVPIRLVGLKAFDGDGISEAGVGLVQVAQYIAAEMPQRSIDWLELDDVAQFAKLSSPTDPLMSLHNVQDYVTLLVSLTRRRYTLPLPCQLFHCHLALWNPYVYLDTPTLPTLLSYGQTPSALAAVAAVLANKCSISGTFPG